MAEPLLQVNDLKVHFPVGKTLFRPGVTVKAVDGVSWSVNRDRVRPRWAALCCG